MTDVIPDLNSTDEQIVQLDWAFSIINEFMQRNDLAVLRNRSRELVITYIGDDS